MGKGLGMGMDKATTAGRDEWEVRDDMRAVKTAIEVFKDKERLRDVQALIKKEREAQDALDLVASGDLGLALGLV